MVILPKLIHTFNITVWKSLLPSFSSVAQLCLTICNPMDCSTIGFASITNSQSLLKLMSNESVRPSNHLILCHPFFSCLQFFPASKSFPVSQFFAAGDQSIRASASASVFPMNIQGGFLLGLTGLISLLSKGLSRIFSKTTVQKHQFFGTQPSLWSNSHHT